MNEVRILLPHGSNRPQVPTRIVVHTMAEYIRHEGRVSHAVNFLDRMGLSAHFFVTPKGDLIRCRKDDQVAWHAKSYNINSLGIEFLVECDPKFGMDYRELLEAMKTDYLTKDQFDSGVEKVNEWCNLHNIKHIDRHSTLSPKRKSDPGSGFPWQEFRAEINYIG